MPALDAIVIGAGISGLAATLELVRAGRHVLVLDALDRAGGRIWTRRVTPPPSPSPLLEMGATWIHGTEGNALYSYTESRGLVPPVVTECEEESEDEDEDEDEWDDTRGEGRGTAHVWRCSGRESHTAGAAACPFDALSFPVGEWADIPSASSAPCARTHTVHPSHVRLVLGAYSAIIAAAGDGPRPRTQHSSIGDFVREEWEKVLSRWTRTGVGSASAGPSAPLPLPLVPAYAALFSMRVTAESVDTGCPNLSSVSLRWWGDHLACLGRDARPAAGMGAVIDALLDDIRGGGGGGGGGGCGGPGGGRAEVLLGKEVVRIDCGRTAGDDILRLASVECADGSAYTAPLVIVTVSLGVLKGWVGEGVGGGNVDNHCPGKEAALPVFNPPLPAEKVDAIRALGFGVVEKVHAVYPTAWWRTMAAAGDADGAGAGAGAGAASPEQLPTLPGRGDAGGVTFLWGSGDDDDDDEVKRLPPWARRLFRAYEETPTAVGSGDDSTAPPTLTWWLTGPEAAAAAASESPDALSLTLAAVASRFCGDSSSAAPPARLVCSSWTASPFFRGCYSHVPSRVGEAAPDLFAALAAPVAGARLLDPLHALGSEADGDGTSLSASIAHGIRPLRAAHASPPPSPPFLLFAGEATHRHHYSTAHGALESGVREGKRAARMLSAVREGRA
jgi:hypothetical protein